MSTATVTSKGQITLPKAIRESLGVERGDQIEFVEGRQGEIHIRPLKYRLEDLGGFLSRPGTRRAAVREMDDAVRDGAAKDDDRIRAGRTDDHQ